MPFRKLKDTNLADVSDIFYFFLAGVGKGRRRPSGWPGARFLLEIRGRGGGAEEVAGAGGGKALGACLGGGGGGGAKLFFFRAEVPTKLNSEACKGGVCEGGKSQSRMHRLQSFISRQSLVKIIRSFCTKMAKSIIAPCVRTDPNY